MFEVFKTITEEENVRLQSAEYMSSSSRKIVEVTLEDEDINISTERFKVLLDDYIDKNVMYEFLKDKLAKDNIPYDLLGKVDWSLDFATAKLTLTFENEDYKNELLVNGYKEEV